MRKTLLIVAGFIGLGAFVYFLTKKKAPVVALPPTASTGTAGFLDQFFPGFKSIYQPTIGAKYDRTGAILNASGAVIKQLPTLIDSIGSLFKPNPSSVTSVTHVPANDSRVNKYNDLPSNSFEDYFDNNTLEFAQPKSYTA